MNPYNLPVLPFSLPTNPFTCQPCLASLQVLPFQFSVLLAFQSSLSLTTSCPAAAAAAA